MAQEDRGQSRPSPELFKLAIQPVLILRQDGEIVGEQLAEPVTFYSIEKAKEWLDLLPTQIASFQHE